jgi:hypothetical protein
MAGPGSRGHRLAVAADALNEGAVSKDEGIRVPLDLTELEAGPVTWANLFLLQYDRGDWILTTAQVPPPVVVGDNQAAQVAERGSISARLVSRVAVSRGKLEALSQLIERQLKRFPPGDVGSPPEIVGEGEDSA